MVAAGAFCVAPSRGMPSTNRKLGVGGEARKRVDGNKWRLDVRIVSVQSKLTRQPPGMCCLWPVKLESLADLKHEDIFRAVGGIVLDVRPEASWESVPRRCSSAYITNRVTSCGQTYKKQGANCNHLRIRTWRKPQQGYLITCGVFFDGDQSLPW